MNSLRMSTSVLSAYSCRSSSFRATALHRFLDSLYLTIDCLLEHFVDYFEVTGEVGAFEAPGQIDIDIEIRYKNDRAFVLPRYLDKFFYVFHPYPGQVDPDIGGGRLDIGQFPAERQILAGGRIWGLNKSSLPCRFYKCASLVFSYNIYVLCCRYRDGSKMMKKYYESDADISVLKGKKIAVLGYGSQGRGQSLNLRDSGLDVIVGLRKGKSWDAAAKDGMTVMTVTEAAKKADIIQILLPDELQAGVYKSEVMPYLSEGKTLMFSHGFQYPLRPDRTAEECRCDHGRRPRAPGSWSAASTRKARAYRHLLPSSRTTRVMPTRPPLRMQRGSGRPAPLCSKPRSAKRPRPTSSANRRFSAGELPRLSKAGFETLVDAGYAPEMAYLEVCHEMKLIVDLIYEGGLTNMRQYVSNTAQYGDMTRGPRVIGPESYEAMEEILAEIQSGEFAKEWMLENMVNRPVFNALTKADEEHLLETTGKEVRAMMPQFRK